jgi:hypothetical protein
VEEPRCERRLKEQETAERRADSPPVMIVEAPKVRCEAMGGVAATTAAAACRGWMVRTGGALGRMFAMTAATEAACLRLLAALMQGGRTGARTRAAARYGKATVGSSGAVRTAATPWICEAGDALTLGESRSEPAPATFAGVATRAMAGATEAA